MGDHEPKVDEALAIEHGLKREEYLRFVKLIGRTPTFTELGIVSAMWNEHCSYKSSRLHLRGLPTKAPWVIQGPGENAGVIDIGDGFACVFKMESHNHPSFIEPYQGAATGVGGILRDVFTMGARPVACLNFLRFGSPDDPKTRHLISGVVAGIGGYGNSFGVPTVGGSVGFHKAYDGNILVNAMAVGVARADAIFYAKATGVGNPIVYLGSKTGRDGIHGATMASAAFEADADEKRPTVQVGDPFAEKLLLEACLELMASGAVVAIQDMGAAGLTSSAVEMGAKGDLGVELDLDAVPCREAGMTAYEMMLSESQERMLMVLKPELEAQAEDIFRKWGLDFAVIGKTTDTMRFVVKHKGEVKADLPIKELGDEAPLYDRPWTPTAPSPVLDGASIVAAHPDRRRAAETAWLAGSLLEALGLPAVRFAHPRQHRSRAGRRGSRHPPRPRAEGPGADDRLHRALLRGRSARRGKAGGRGSLAQPRRGRGAAAGADRQSQFRQSGEAARHGPAGRLRSRASAKRPARSIFRSSRATCRFTTRRWGRAFRRPPRSAGWASSPTSRRRLRPPSRRKATKFCSSEGSPGWLGRSAWLSVVAAREEGAPPPVDLAAERRNGEFVASLIAERRITAAQDLSDGGLAVALAEMAMAGGIGASIEASGPEHAFFFGEDQGRYVVTAAPAETAGILEAAGRAGVPAARIGVTGGDALKLGGARPAGLAELRRAHETWLPDYMGQGAA